MKIFAFGDSFTNCYDDIRAKHVEKYIEFKGYKPKGYVDYLSEYYDCESINSARQGFDNLSILSSISKVIDQIQKDDIIIINWTQVERFRVVNYKNEWETIIAKHLEVLDDTNISKKTAYEVMLNRLSPHYIDELNGWAKIISILFKDNNILQWSYIEKLQGDIIKYIEPIFETIDYETKNRVNDKHFSEKGNLDLANKIIFILDN